MIDYKNLKENMFSRKEFLMVFSLILFPATLIIITSYPIYGWFNKAPDFIDGSFNFVMMLIAVFIGLVIFTKFSESNLDFRKKLFLYFVNTVSLAPLYVLLLLGYVCAYDGRCL